MYTSTPQVLPLSVNNGSSSSTITSIKNGTPQRLPISLNNLSVGGATASVNVVNQTKIAGQAKAAKDVFTEGMITKRCCDLYVPTI